MKIAVFWLVYALLGFAVLETVFSHIRAWYEFYKEVMERKDNERNG